MADEIRAEEEPEVEGHGNIHKDEGNIHRSEEPEGNIHRSEDVEPDVEAHGFPPDRSGNTPDLSEGNTP